MLWSADLVIAGGECEPNYQADLADWVEGEAEIDECGHDGPPLEMFVSSLSFLLFLLLCEVSFEFVFAC